MKTILLFIMLAFLFSISSFSQKGKTTQIKKKLEVPYKDLDTIVDVSPINIRTITSYHVEENINQKFGGYTITYTVSDINLIYFYDLGPNNTRIITPFYGETKQIPIRHIKLNKILLYSTKLSDLVLLNKSKIEPLTTNISYPSTNITENEIKEVKKDTNKSLISEKYIIIHLLETYERIAEKGSKSIEIFQKLGDAYFFEGDYIKAVKWYNELFKMTTNLQSEYFERYIYSLRAIGNTEKAKEIKILLNQSLLNNDGM
jgi:tetratricopeptide (TPR) repeat protein